MKQLKIKIKDKEYKLEMNRKSVKFLEAYGFSLEDFEKKPVTFYDLLWSSLFVQNHSDINMNDTLELQEEYVKEHNRATFNSIVKFAVDEYESFILALSGTNLKEEAEALEIVDL